jgi:hypothetical protein
MPIFKAGSKLVLYAHVPKCGGSAVGWYLAERFGALAFSDRQHTRQPPALRWSRTSPQHIDRASLARLFPAGFFDATFTIVRHPVPRLVSAYHFQLEVEKTIPERTLFSDWLEDIVEMRRENPFLHDNHVRPMGEIVPEDARVFHMEHGLDGLIPWFDAVTGETAGPRAIPRMNEKGAYTAATTERVRPSDNDLARIAEIYAADFARFGYDPADTRTTSAPPPALTPDFEAERDAALRRMGSPLGKLRAKVSARLRA